MALRIDPTFALGEGEPVADGIRRIATGQLDEIADHLDVTDETSVHEARKSFKRLRAVVRLSRDQLGDETRRRENAAFRDAGRELSGARDARVLVETLDKLDAEGFAGLRAALIADHERAVGSDDRPDEVAIREAIHEARERVATWPLDDAGPATLAPGLRRIHKRGRRAYKAAKQDPSSANLHELRKRTKDLWHAAQILEAAAPKRMHKTARDAHKLADQLGDEHDLVTLLGAAARHRATMTDEELRDLEKLIGRRRAKLQRKALRRARDLYSAKVPKLG